MIKYIILSLIFLSSLYSNVDILLSSSTVKIANTFRVDLKSDTRLDTAPTVTFLKQKYQMFSKDYANNTYEVFIPVSYYTKQLKYNVNISYKLNNKTIKKRLYIDVIDANYKKNEIITVAKGKVKLSSKNKKKSSNEYSKVYKNVYSVISPKNYIKNSNFINPIDSKITSDFGTARIYNGIKRSYHTGVDFRAKTPVEVRATNNGVVALTMKRFYLGNVIYINHGRGLYSYYSHLSKFLVKKGQYIKKGQVIALSGKTGRITAPHLHYALRLYNTTIDPLGFHKLYEKGLK
jgi:murein DD-endopeptidase MepM/ murein hydrolase activator NlpD